MPSIREIDPHHDAALRAWYEATYTSAVAGRRFPLVFSFESLAASLRNPSTTATRSVFAAFDGEHLVGALKLDFPLKENLDCADWTLNVAPQHRGRGFGTALYEHGMAVAAAKGRRRQLAEVDVPFEVDVQAHPGSRFALKHGFTSRHTEERMVLQLPVPQERLAELAEAARPHHGDYDFTSWVDGCPEELVDAFVDMRNTMERDVPTGELDCEPTVWTPQRLRESEQRLLQQGFTSLVTAARHRGGEFAGYSLMFVPANSPAEVNQDDTLVVAAHRGHRLGTALKVRNLQSLRQRFGDRRRVHTWTDPDNTPMRDINRRFGFTSVEVMHEFERVDPA